MSFIYPSPATIIGRNQEIQQIFRILIRMSKNNSLLVYKKSGVGCSSILRGVVNLSKETKQKYKFLKFDTEKILKHYPTTTANLLYLLRKIESKYKLILIVKDTNRLLFLLDLIISCAILSILDKESSTRIIGIVNKHVYKELLEKDGSLENFF